MTSRQGATCWLILAIFLASPLPASAGINATGDVSPNPPGAGNFVTVGGITPGFLRVDGGSSLPLEVLEVGGSSVGEITVSGPGSSLSTQGDLVLGTFRFDQRLGAARLDIRDGAFVEVGNELRLAQDGQQVQVTLAGGFLDVRNSVRGGSVGGGLIEVTDGGVLSAENFFETGLDISVSGPGSALIAQGSLQLLGGDLQIGAGASVTTSSIGLSPDARALLSGGTLLAAQLGNQGLIRGDGRVVVGGGQFPNQGRIEAGPEEELRVVGASFVGGPSLINFGEIVTDGGSVELGLVENQSEGNGQRGTITLRDGTVRFRDTGSPFEPSVRNQGLLSATGGTNELHGVVDNRFDGQIAVTNDSTLIFHDRVVNDSGGEISVMPGSRAVFLGGLEMQGGTLLANLAGTDDDTGFGVAEVVGGATLFGQVSIALTDGFEPGLGDRFSLLTASSGIQGEPTLGETPDLSEGLIWEVLTDTNTLSLLVAPELSGDFNLDGSVDAADYTVWRDGLGAQFTASDFSRWIENFGATSAATAQAVPEPAALALLILVGAAGTVTRRCG